MSKAHALIIDDNRLNIDVLTMLLTKEEVSYTAIDSPQKLLHTLDTVNDVDVIFLDLEFPQGDGFQLLTVIKAHPSVANVPVVAYTVHTSEIDEARRAGFDSFLGKPLNPQAFPTQLKRILNRLPVWEV